VFDYLLSSPPATVDSDVPDLLTTLTIEKFFAEQGHAGAPRSNSFETSENAVTLSTEAVYSALHCSESPRHFVPRQTSKPGARAQCFSLVPEYVDNYRDVVSCEREYLSQYSGSGSDADTCHDDPSFMYDMYTCVDLPPDMCRFASSSCCRSCGSSAQVSSSPGNQVSSSGWSAEVQQLNIVMPPELTQSKSNEARQNRGNG
jgi:hypothetical protein